MTLSDGADTLTRDPKPLEKFVKPVQRVSAHACCAPRTVCPMCWGGSEKMSSSVVPPTSMDPLSKSCEGTPENSTSLRLVGVPPDGMTSVGVVPPEGPIAAFVNVRVPSPDEMHTTMP